MGFGVAGMVGNFPYPEVLMDLGESWGGDGWGQVTHDFSTPGHNCTSHFPVDGLTVMC